MTYYTLLLQYNNITNVYLYIARRSILQNVCFSQILIIITVTNNTVSFILCQSI